MVFSEVVDQRLSDPGGSGNQMISDMQVINFLTRARAGLPGGEKSRGDEAGKQWLPSFFNGHGLSGQATAQAGSLCP
jgi:hypothetical protein